MSLSDSSIQGVDTLVRLLDDYPAVPASRADLVELLRPYRLALRSTPSLRLTYGNDDRFWSALGRVWSEEAARLGQDENDSTVKAISALAGFTMSLCTQSPSNQQQAVAHVEPQIRRVLLEASSFVNLQDPKYTDMTRICCQALANFVTANPQLAGSFFVERLHLEESDKLLQRLLASPDHGTIQAILIFVLNSIHSNPARALLLGTSKGGADVLDRIMVIVGTMFEDEKADAMAQQDFTSDIFGLNFFIVQQLVTQGAFEQAYVAHALMPGYAISPTLVTMLKFLDGHLSLPEHAAAPTSLSLVPFLVRQLEHLAGSLVEDSSAQARSRDAADAGTFQGVVLVLHCLCSIGLALEREESAVTVEAEVGERASRKMVDGVEAVVRLLGFSQTLMPPPSARPTPPDSASTSAAATQSPSVESPSNNPAADDIAQDAAKPPDEGASSSGSPDGVAAIAQLQRTSVQYLGIVSFLPPERHHGESTLVRVKAAQDRVRLAGGLGLVLGMCQIDQRNPTMREHALFAIRNLLKGNQENQDFVDAMKPEFRIGQNGELLDLPPALRTT